MADLPPLPGDLPQPQHASRLAGGDVDEVWDVTLSDGTRVVVKRSASDARLEAEGLQALRAAGGPVPQVVAVDAQVLVIEHVGDLQPRPRSAGVSDGEAGRGLGVALAQVHQQTGPAFGWRRDNVIGPLPQANPPTDDWPTFYVEHRLRPYLDVLPAGTRSRLEVAMSGPLPALLDHGAEPSLVHGDLWSGNIVANRWLIDPAVHYADRELDLAMLDLFGGVPRGLREGYERQWPLDSGWQQRRPALQLYHLLVHVKLFGGGYLGSVEQRLDRLGY